ncbi:glycosyltransferase [Pseudomonas citronellolis]|nr:glycosyltransferase [Pseudomonas citronellolis]WRT85106.1 glycosyltransferase [Pseudomonas citronellolis]
MKNLRQAYQDHLGKTSDKWSLYLDKYEDLFRPYREAQLSILEIGIQNGGSLEIWADYFSNAKAIIGCDINLACQKLAFEDSRIRVIVEDANTAEAERQITSLSEGLDIVIDDGSHTSSDIVRSFQRYFKHLKDGGIFVTEDLHCSYWQEFEGGLYAPYSAIAFFKRLADISGHEHWGIDLKRRELLQGFSVHYSIEFDEELLSHIHSVEFANSLCIIRKAVPARNILGKRIIVGDQASVMPEIKALAGQESVTFDQSTNPYAKRPVPPEEEFYQRLAELEQSTRLIQQQQECIEKLQESESGLRETLETLRQHSSAQTTKLQERESEAAHLKHVLSVKEHDIAALLGSTSWKFSAPVRLVGRQVWRLRRLREIFAVQRAHMGGSFQVLTKAVGLVRKYGLRGVKDRLKWASISLAQAGTNADTSYANWVRHFDSFNDEKRQGQIALARTFNYQPLISVLMPVYNAPIDFLDAAIRSVLQQTYDKWELCIADDASTDPQVRELLERFEREDSRVKVVYREANGHIANASNSALEIAQGEYIALLDQDDLLPEYALFFVAQAINQNPDAGILYSDEDKLDEQGQRTTPYFKPDFNLYLFRSQNMISHFGIYRTDLVKSVGAFRVGFEGSQDYDLALRCVEQLERRQIVHIPRVLYHWRIHAGSTARAEDEKPYAAHAGVKSLQEHLQRIGCAGEVLLQPMGMYRIRYTLPSSVPMVSLIIPTRNAYELVKQCIDSILSLTTYPNYEIILIDNGSDEPRSLEYFSELNRQEKIRVIRDESPFNYSALNNSAARLANGEYIGLINNDIEVITPDWLEEMVSHAAQPNVGAVGARLWYPDNRLQHGGVIVGLGGVACHAHKLLPKGEYGYFCRATLTQEFSAVTAACLIVKKAIFDQVGGLNEDDLKVAFNDVDLCLRIQEAGYVNVWTPFAELYHHESATRGYEDTPEKRARFQSEIDYMQRRWPNLLADYAYNPNLTLNSEDFSLGWPPRITL